MFIRRVDIIMYLSALKFISTCKSYKECEKFNELLHDMSNYD